MAVCSPIRDKIQSMDASTSSHIPKIDTSHDSDTSSSLSSSNAVFENSDSSYRKDQEIQSPANIRSEECRLLFHLPPEEVLVQDFNCALQENILLQGHMYLFVHHICFYSNIFGYETKKTIPFSEVTCVRKAKTVAIFPNAIEIVTGERKHFFASFLSRDEAFRLIVDGWSEHNSNAKAILELQESKSDTGSPENMLVLFEKFKNFKRPTNDLCSPSGESSNAIEDGKPSPSCVDDALATLSTKHTDLEGNCEKIAEDSSCRGSFTWKLEDADAPEVPENYTLVSESKFQIRAEEFFNLFFSDNAVGFVETFHKKCKDKEFQCTSWVKHDQFGHVRDVSFQHPIKLYFGAKFGCCRETQKFRVYKNSHLIIETSQQISDVPYGDHFQVEGLWDVEQKGEENAWCTLRVYVYVVFSKKTMWKGKIEQSTIEECREAYAIWNNSAHELLKQKQKQNLGDMEGVASNDAGPMQNTDSGSKSLSELKRPSARTQAHKRISRRTSGSKDMSPLLPNGTREELNCASPLTSIIRELWISICAYLKSHSHMPLILAIAFMSVLILTQLSIIVLLTRAPRVHLISQENFLTGLANDRTEAVAWLEKRVAHLKEEMLMVETRLEKMRREYSLLSAHIQGLEQMKTKL